MYESVIKRGLDWILSGFAIILLAIPMVVIAILIKMDSKGPVLFQQKRVGKDKTYFQIYKFRTMRTDTPHDAPTHELKNAASYITKVGGFLRKTSLDELPQIFNIWRGDMAIVGPRPALWNQFDLIEQRDAYGANDVRPGLTGWAQIHGRDELEIEEKSRLDGYYVNQLKKGILSAMKIDLQCFFGTFLSVLRSEGVVEGGTGAKK